MPKKTSHMKYIKICIKSDSIGSTYCSLCWKKNQIKVNKSKYKIKTKVSSP